MRPLFLILALLSVCANPGWTAQSPQPDFQRLATAVYWAEGGPKTSHPYGVLAHYQYTSPRQACLNTIHHAYRDWSGRGSFIHFLASRYAPVGSNTDVGTNRYWERNVTLIYRRII